MKAAVEKTVATFGQRPWDPSSSQVRIVFYVFDLLILGGKDVMGKTLRERRTLLETKVLPLLGEPIRYSSQLDAPSRSR